jgi:glycosyltransferase involved in cell wall biosynthesis
MRIAYVTFEYPPFIMGGAGIHAKNITNELARQGHQIVIFTPAVNESIADEETDINIEVIRVPVHPKIPFKALQFWLRLPKEIKRIENKRMFDIIHFNGISYWFLKKRIVNAPHILTIHHLVTDAITSSNENFLSRLKNISGENGFVLPFIEKRCIQSADKIIAVSKFTRDQIIQTYNVNISKIEVIYNGFNDSKYTFSEQELNEIKLKFSISDKPIVLFVGRIDDPRKGLDTLIKSFKLVLKNIDSQLLVVGKGEQKRLSDLAEFVADKIIFTGYIDEITLQKCYALCDVYVCPSRLEGFGLTLIEAFAAGKPVVATNVGAIPELLHDGKNGILVEKDDIPGMAKAIVHYLKNPQLCEKIGMTNIKTLDEKFKWGTNVKDLVKIYEVS